MGTHQKGRFLDSALPETKEAIDRIDRAMGRKVPPSQPPKTDEKPIKIAVDPHADFVRDLR